MMTVILLLLLLPPLLLILLLLLLPLLLLLSNGNIYNRTFQPTSPTSRTYYPGGGQMLRETTKLRNIPDCALWHIPFCIHSRISLYNGIIIHISTGGNIAWNSMYQKCYKSAILCPKHLILHKLLHKILCPKITSNGIIIIIRRVNRLYQMNMSFCERYVKTKTI